MKQFCPQCLQPSVDGNLWCPRPDCPVEQMPSILGGSQMVGDVEVSRLLYMLPGAAIYEARQAKKPVLLKVAHADAQDRLEREAWLLLSLQRDRYPFLPILRPPLADIDLAKRPYNCTGVNGRTVYYLVFEHNPGIRSLREWLLRTPQPWFQDALAVTGTVAVALAVLHRLRRLHLNLTPETLAIVPDRNGKPQPLLLDLGMIREMKTPGSDVTTLIPTELRWIDSAGDLGYLAPELLDESQTRRVTEKTDVYGLGLLLYEMLAGHAAYPTAGRERKYIIRDIVSGEHAALQRDDIQPEISVLAEKAIKPKPIQRYSLGEFAQELRPFV